MKRALPYLLFAGLAILPFRGFLLRGDVIHTVRAVEMHLDPGKAPSPTLLGLGARDDRIMDEVLLMPLLLRQYNEGLKEGELRLWNPNLVGGLPSYTDPMLHPFYPPNLLIHALLPPDPAFEILLMLHLFFSGLAMFRMLLAFGRSRPAATIGALVWMVGGYHAVWFSSAILLGLSVFAPLATLWLVTGMERGDLRRGSAAGLAMGLAVLGSHPQHALCMFLLLSTWVLVEAVRQRDRRREIVRIGAVFALVAVGVGMVDVLPRLETIAMGYRDPESAMSFYDSPGVMFARLAGIFAGQAMLPETLRFNFHEFYGYAGLAAAGLAVLGAVTGRRDPRVRFVTYFGGAALLVCFIAPLAKLIALIPFLNLSPPYRWIHAAGFCLALLCSFGADALAASGRRYPFALGGTAAGMTILALAGGDGSAAVMVGLVGAAVAVAAAFTVRFQDGLALPLTACAVLIELAPGFLVLNRHDDGAVLRERPPAVEFALQRQGADAPWRGTGVLSGAFHARRGNASTHLHVGNNMLAWHGVENVCGFEALVPSAYARFCEAAGAKIYHGGRVVQFRRFDSPLVDLVGLKYLFLPSTVPTPEGFRPVREFGSVRLDENPEAFPRAWFVGEAVPASDWETDLARLASPRFDPRTTVILEGAGTTHAVSATSRVTTRRLTTDVIEVDVTTDRDGYLVLSETFYPGWEATVDGTPAGILRANVAFRAVRVDKGTHVVRFAFRPASVRRGAWVTILAVVATLAAVMLYRRKGAAS